MATVTTSRRDAIRRARLQERVSLEAREALDREGLLDKVRDKVEEWVNRAIAENGIHDIRHISEQVCADARYHVQGSQLPATLSSDLCQFCQARIHECGCNGTQPHPSKALPQHLVEDEYALLALARADEAKDNMRKEKLAQAARRQGYAADLQELVAEHARAQQAAAEEKRREAARLAAEAESYRREEAAQRAARSEKRAQCADELDQFCAAQRQKQLERIELERVEEHRLLNQAARADAEERRRLAHLREQQHEELLKDQRNYAESLEQRKRAQELERQRDVEFARLADLREKERDAQRAREKEAILAKQQEIFATMGTELGRIERERREALEDAFVRWEVESQQREAAKLAQQQRQRQLSLQNLAQTREQQIYEHRCAQERSAAEQAAYARELQFRARLEEEKDKAQRRHMLAERQLYNQSLKQQMAEEQRTRKERLRIGMNEVERRMNMPLLRSYNLVDDRGQTNTCWTGRCSGVCTCPRALREQRYHHGPIVPAAQHPHHC